MWHYTVTNCLLPEQNILLDLSIEVLRIQCISRPRWHHNYYICHWNIFQKLYFLRNLARVSKNDPSVQPIRGLDFKKIFETLPEPTDTSLLHACIWTRFCPSGWVLVMVQFCFRKIINHFILIISSWSIHHCICYWLGRIFKIYENYIVYII